jgi:hypothetical protein
MKCNIILPLLGKPNLMVLAAHGCVLAFGAQLTELSRHLLWVGQTKGSAKN